MKNTLGRTNLQRRSSGRYVPWSCFPSLVSLHPVLPFFFFSLLWISSVRIAVVTSSPHTIWNLLENLHTVVPEMHWRCTKHTLTLRSNFWRLWRSCDMFDNSTYEKEKLTWPPSSLAHSTLIPWQGTNVYIISTRLPKKINSVLVNFQPDCQKRRTLTPTLIPHSSLLYNYPVDFLSYHQALFIPTARLRNIFFYSFIIITLPECEFVLV